MQEDKNKFLDETIKTLNIKKEVDRSASKASLKNILTTVDKVNLYDKLKNYYGFKKGISTANRNKVESIFNNEFLRKALLSDLATNPIKNKATLQDLFLELMKLDNKQLFNKNSW